jgi:hypothetical protein
MHLGPEATRGSEIRIDEATLSNASWCERAGAMEGGSAESFRWRRIFRITSSWVMATMICCAPAGKTGDLIT